MPFDLKSATPDTSITTGAVLFGADSQSATDPSVYPIDNVVTYLAGLNYTWTGTHRFDQPINFSGDTYLVRDAANTLAQRNGVSTQTYYVYNTFTDASNYERTGLKFATYSSVRYAQLVAESAGTGTSNIGMVLGAKGTGAITAQMPDGTTAGGNARGANGVDLQTVRLAATEVASGTSAFAAGQRNTASGAYSFAAGQNNAASGSYSAAWGLNGTATGSGAVAWGAASNATANYATAFGWVCTASAAYAVAHGYSAAARLQAANVHSFGTFAGSTPGQCVQIGHMGQTTNATQTEIFLSNAANVRATIPANTAYAFETRVVARSSTGADLASFRRSGIIKRDGSNNTALVGSVQTVGTDIGSNAGGAPAGWAVLIDADDTNESLRVQVTGAAATTINWLAYTSMIEIGA